MAMPRIGKDPNDATGKKPAFGGPYRLPVCFSVCPAPISDIRCYNIQTQGLASAEYFLPACDQKIW